MQRLRAVLIVTVLATGNPEAWAQTLAYGSIRGYVLDEQGAAFPGVTITATSSESPTPLIAISDHEGHYRLLSLPPGTYSVSAELQGFAKLVRDNIVIQAGLNLGLNLVMKVGNLTESVVVRGETPLLETSNAGQAVNVSAEMQQALPLGARRHWSDFLNLAPGTISNDSPGQQAAIFYVHGAGLVSSSTRVDGADMSSSVNPWQSYVAFATDTVADVQVKTAGMDASSPLGYGSAVAAVTRSGTNHFSGSATFAYTAKSWVGNNQPGGSSQTQSIVQPEGVLGGPIKADRLWFFGSYRHRRGTIGISRTADDIANLKALVPSFEPFDNNVRADIYFIKGTGQISPGQRASAYYSYDKTPHNQNGALNAGNFTETVIGGHGVSARVESLWTSWLTSQTGFSWNNKAGWIDLLQHNVPSQPVFRTVQTSAGQLVGTGQIATLGSTLSATQFPYTKWSLTSDWSAYRSGLLGSHEFRFGVSLQPRMNRVDTIEYANGGNPAEVAFVLRDANNPAGGSVPFRQVVYDTASAIGERGHFSDNAFYVQDSWRPSKRLTISLGVRVDRITRHDDLFDVRVQDSVEVGPRVGLNYVVTDDQRNILRASVGRIHEAANVNHQTANGAGNFSAGDTTVGTIGFRTIYDMNLDGVWDATFVTPAASRTNPNRIIDPDYSQPYVDEWSVGYSRQFRGQASIDIGYLHRDYKHRPALVEQNGVYDGSVFRGYRNESLNEIYLLTVNRWNWPIYKALELVATKRTNRMQILGSYTHVWANVAGTWQPHDPASFIQPDAFPLDRGLPGNDNRLPSPNNGLNAGTGQPEFTPEILRLAGVYYAPWSINVAATYVMQRGRSSGPILDRLPAPDPRFGPPTLTLSNGRVVSNPLATTTRFAFPTRSEEQFLLPAAHFLNIRLGRDFRWGRDKELNVSFDLLNLPNRGDFQGFMGGANQQFSPNYGRFSQVQQPRTAQLGLTVRF